MLFFGVSKFVTSLFEPAEKILFYDFFLVSPSLLFISKKMTEEGEILAASGLGYQFANSESGTLFHFFQKNTRYTWKMHMNVKSISDYIRMVSE